MNKACKLIDNNKWDEAQQMIFSQTMTQINQGRGLFEKFGDENKAMEKGQKISLEPGPDGKYEIVDICKYCEKHDEYFKEPSVIQNHIKNKCKMLTNCKFCRELVEVVELKEHWLFHCKKN